VPVVQRETPDQSEVLVLLGKADERSTSLYPAESRHGLALSALLSARLSAFLREWKLSRAPRRCPSKLLSRPVGRSLATGAADRAWWSV